MFHGKSILAHIWSIPLPFVVSHDLSQPCCRTTHHYPVGFYMVVHTYKPLPTLFEGHRTAADLVAEWDLQHLPTTLQSGRTATANVMTDTDSNPDMRPQATLFPRHKTESNTVVCPTQWYSTGVMLDPRAGILGTKRGSSEGRLRPTR